MTEWFLWHSLIVVLIVVVSFICGFLTGKVIKKSDSFRFIPIRKNQKG